MLSDPAYQLILLILGEAVGIWIIIFSVSDSENGMYRLTGQADGDESTS